MPRDGYLLYEPSLEQIQPGERETIQAIVDSIGRTGLSLYFSARSQQRPKLRAFIDIARKVLRKSAAGSR
jgi:hypothetical protein